MKRVRVTWAVLDKRWRTTFAASMVVAYAFVVVMAILGAYVAAVVYLVGLTAATPWIMRRRLRRHPPPASARTPK